MIRCKFAVFASQSVAEVHYSQDSRRSSSIFSVSVISSQDLSILILSMRLSNRVIPLREVLGGVVANLCLNAAFATEWDENEFIGRVPGLTTVK